MREEVPSVCEQLWPICTPVFVNVKPATLMQGERAESESEVGQAANASRNKSGMHLQGYSTLCFFDEVINKTNKVKEGKRST